MLQLLASPNTKESRGKWFLSPRFRPPTSALLFSIYTLLILLYISPKMSVRIRVWAPAGLRPDWSQNWEGQNWNPGPQLGLRPDWGQTCERQNWNPGPQLGLRPDWSQTLRINHFIQASFSSLASNSLLSLLLCVFLKLFLCPPLPIIKRKRVDEFLTHFTSKTSNINSQFHIRIHLSMFSYFFEYCFLSIYYLPKTCELSKGIGMKCMWNCEVITPPNLNLCLSSSNLENVHNLTMFYP